MRCTLLNAYFSTLLRDPSIPSNPIQPLAPLCCIYLCCVLPRRKANQILLSANMLRFQNISKIHCCWQSQNHLFVVCLRIFFDCYSVMSDSVESLLRKTGVEFEVPGFDDSGSVSRNGFFNNNICWFCTVVQNGDSRIDPNQQIVSPKTRETTNYTVGFLHTHQQVNKSCCVLLLIEIQMNTKNSAVCYWSMKFPPPNPLPLLVFC